MKLARIIVPTNAQDGMPIAPHEFAKIEDALYTAFGGYTSGRSSGKWRDATGRMITEELKVYDVAYDHPTADAIVEVAKHLAHIVRQPIQLEHEGKSLIIEDTAIRLTAPVDAAPPTDPSGWPQVFDVAIQTVIGTELHAVQDHFGVRQKDDTRPLRGSFFYKASVQSAVTATNMSVVVHCQGSAGNDAAAVAAERLITLFNPKAIFLMGIAAGRRDKCRIGDVVTPRAVVDDTEGVAHLRKRLKRLRIVPPPHAMIQQIQNFRCDIAKWHARLLKLSVPPKARRGKTREYRTHVADIPDHHEAAIYSSELLLRDPNVLEAESAKTHQQIKIGEMEAAGFSFACESRDMAVPWFVVRGVSDFGDDLKDDRFHSWASHCAASYLIGLIEGIRIDLLSRRQE